MLHCLNVANEQVKFLEAQNNGGQGGFVLLRDLDGKDAMHNGQLARLQGDLIPQGSNKGHYEVCCVGVGIDTGSTKEESMTHFKPRNVTMACLQCLCCHGHATEIATLHLARTG